MNCAARIVLGTCLAICAGANPAVAQEIDLSQVVGRETGHTLSQQNASNYRAILSAFDREDWPDLIAQLAAIDDGPLKGFIQAEYYLHPRSPVIALQQIEEWLSRYARLPQSERMVALGVKRGLTSPPQLPRANTLVRQPSISKRLRPAPIADGTMPDDVKAGILDSITNDDPDGARMLLDGIDFALSEGARTEWRQRIAWSYYIENRDTAALAMAQAAASGPGPWAAEADWVAGLASWRLGDCQTASAAFARSASGAQNRELIQAAHYWASRAALRCRDPQRAVYHLRRAARDDETLYGMLAAEQLGRPLPATHVVEPLSADDLRSLGKSGNTRLAIQLAGLGRDEWAAEAIEYEVVRGDPRDFAKLAGLARTLGLPRTQIFMGYNVPRGAVGDPSLRFPTAAYAPHEGWRVDPALAFAHALQESDFRASAVSPANAIGLMQVRPIAARDVDDRTDLDARYADLKDPAVNLTFGQRNLEKLGASNVTGGQLPKVMAAYNAGLTPVGRWNTEINDQGDPLLYMESIPYWETRGYVATVMRNYWIYLRQRDAAIPSREALAENKWPAYPRGADGARGAR